MTTYITLTPIQHPVYAEGAIVSADGRTGIIDYVGDDGQGNLYVSIEGPGFDAHESWPLANVTLGGTIPQHPPTDTKTLPHGYKAINLTQPERFVPAGWAVIDTTNNAYVGWGMTSHRDAVIFAVGHYTGKRHLAAKF